MSSVPGLVAQAVGGLVLGAARVVLPLQRLVVTIPHRGLTDAEWAVLEPVFGRSLDRGAIVVVPGRCGVLALSPRPVTLGSMIVLKGDASVGTLVHEAVHVWQYRHRGARYVVDAVRAQLSRDGYDWRAAHARGAGRWAELNTEAQAQCVQDLHARGAFADRACDPAIGGVSYAVLAADVTATLRDRDTAP